MPSRTGSLRRKITFVLAFLVFPLSADAARAQAKVQIEIVPQTPHSGAVDSVAFSPDGSRVLSGSGDGTIKLWDTATGQLLRTFQSHSYSVSSIAFSPDGGRVLS